jgi:hypothetical protein
MHYTCKKLIQLVAILLLAETPPTFQKQGSMNLIKIYISYCHVDERTRQKVRRLAERLHEADGQDVRLDMIKPPSKSWPEWIDIQLIEYDKWVVVCDAEFKRRVDEPNASFLGGGVSMEYFWILNHLYDRQGVNDKIVPVYFLESEPLDVLPRALRRYTFYGVYILTDAEEIRSLRWKGYTKFYEKGLHDLPKVRIRRQVQMARFCTCWLIIMFVL